jgi:hypothetical protein
VGIPRRIWLDGEAPRLSAITGDIVPDVAYVQGLSDGGGHWSLHVAAVGVDRAGVSASDDHELGGLHNFVGEGFGELRDHRDTDPVQDLITMSQPSSSSDPKPSQSSTKPISTSRDSPLNPPGRPCGTPARPRGRNR